MKSISKLLMVISILLSTVSGFTQIKNAKSETVSINGNCEMCKANIEKAGTLKGVANVAWDRDAKTATLTYDSNKTNQDEILKRIALAGYDNEKFLAPDDVYAKLPGCCQYDRTLKPTVNNEESGIDMKSGHGSHNHQEMPQTGTVEKQNIPQLQAVFDHYFAVKDALIKSDGNSSSIQAAALVEAIKAVEMANLSAEAHTVWMKVLKEVTTQAEKIAATKDVAQQRQTFALLSMNIYALVKVSKPETPVYYQHCPMYNNGKGANWLSKEEVVKNPYYGAQMLTCGSVQETIK